jgi:prepilin-type N-terminal cleavage/methylation domain-containing protein
MTSSTIHPAARPHAVRRAFTVVELLVVVVIILIVLTVATPAFQSMLYSAARSESANSVNAAVLAAREIALRSASGDDGAVVFVYDRDGTMRVIPAVRVGTVLEPVYGAGGAGGGPSSLGGSPRVRRDVFAPVPQAAAFQMPAFWNVRGYAPANSMIEYVAGERPSENLAVWYNSAMYGAADVTDEAKLEGNWVFPETAFYDIDQPSSRSGPNAPTARQSFMIRFDSATGTVSADRSPALFIDPRPSTVNRPGGARPQAVQRWLRPDRAEDLGAWARGLIASPPINANGDRLRPPFTEASDATRLSFIGMSSNDTILVKPVSRIAVYDERVMARDLGARRLNANTNSLYSPVARGSNAGGNQIDLALFPNATNPEALRQRINRWLDGDTNNDGTIDDDDQPQARIYLLRPGTGDLTEVLR